MFFALILLKRTSGPVPFIAWIELRKGANALRFGWILTEAGWILSEVPPKRAPRLGIHVPLMFEDFTMYCVEPRGIVAPSYRWMQIGP